MEVKFYLKRPNSIVKTAITARVSYYGLQLKYYLPNLSIEPKYWNKEKKQAILIKGFSQAPELNRSLSQIKETIEGIYFQLKALNNQEEPTLTVFKKAIDKALSRSNDTASERQEKTFWSFFEKSIKDMESGVRVTLRGNVFAKGTIKTFKNLYNKLQDFEKYRGRKIEFDNIDNDTYTKYLHYTLNILKLHRNTVGKQITFWKNILKDAYDRNLTTSTVHTARWFKSFQEETFAIYLTEKDVQEISNLDLSQNKKLERVKDLFVIGCYTGLRYSDLTNLTEKNIVGNAIQTVQQKTGNAVEIPLRPQVWAILNKYNGSFPRNKLRENPISNQKYNEYLKEVCKLVEAFNVDVEFSVGTGIKKTKAIEKKYNLITSHTARRSFATNEFLAKDIHVHQIRAITGHKTDKAFYKYIRLTPNDNAKEVAKIWATRETKKLKAV